MAVLYPQPPTQIPASGTTTPLGRIAAEFDQSSRFRMPFRGEFLQGSRQVLAEAFSIPKNPR